MLTILRIRNFVGKLIIDVIAWTTHENPNNYSRNSISSSSQISNKHPFLKDTLYHKYCGFHVTGCYKLWLPSGFFLIMLNRPKVLPMNVIIQKYKKALISAKFDMIWLPSFPNSRELYFSIECCLFMREAMIKYYEHITLFTYAIRSFRKAS